MNIVNLNIFKIEFQTEIQLMILTLNKKIFNFHLEQIHTFPELNKCIKKL